MDKQLTSTWTKSLPQQHVWRNQPETSGDQMLSRFYWFLQLEPIVSLDGCDNIFTGLESLHRISAFFLKNLKHRTYFNAKRKV